MPVDRWVAGVRRRHLFWHTPFATVLTISGGIAQAGDGIPYNPEPALLSDRYGDPGYVGFLPDANGRVPDDPIESLNAKALSAAEISSLFAKLCMTKPFDRAVYEGARAESASDFRPTVRHIAATSVAKPLIGSTQIPAVELTQNLSDYGITSLWLGEGADSLKGRWYLRYSGSLIMTGPFEKKDVYAPQCNLTLHVTGLTASKELLDGIERLSAGYTSVKRVEKPKYGYAIWNGPPIEGRVPRLTANLSKLNKPAQAVHITLQLLPAPKAK